MRTLQSYLATTLCLTSTMAVLVVLRMPAGSDLDPPADGDDDLAVNASFVTTHTTYGADGEAEDRPSLAGQMLVAAPDMDDPYFAGTVIYVLADDESGSLGVVLNRTRDHDDAWVAKDGGRRVDLFDGGPVGRDRVFIMHNVVDDPRSVRIGDVAVAAEPEMISEMFEGRGFFAKAAQMDPLARVFVGYAGWGPGQLDRELAHGAWFTADGGPGLVLTRDIDAVTRFGRQTVAQALVH